MRLVLLWEVLKSGVHCVNRGIQSLWARRCFFFFLQSRYNNRQDGCNLLRIVDSGVSLREQEKYRPRVVEERRRLVATNGDDWHRLVASNGDEQRRKETTGVGEWDRSDMASPSGVACGTGRVLLVSRVFPSCVIRDIAQLDRPHRYTENLHKCSTELL